MTYLLLGDPHAKQSNLDESVRLWKWCLGIARENQASIVIMGDLYDTHAVARVEVAYFWRDAFQQAQDALVSVIVIPGNHDMDHACQYSWLNMHKKDAAILSSDGKATELQEGIWAISFVRDNEQFLKECRQAWDKGCKVLLCHQEFNGCQMENGYYSPAGVDRSQLPDGMYLISGHIHKRQDLVGPGSRTVNYIGTPRWLTRSDAGETKGITLWDPTKASMQFVPTPASVAEPFLKLSIKPGDTVPQLPDSGRIHVDVSGPKDFVKSVTDQLPGSIKLRTFVEIEKKEHAAKESHGIPAAFTSYLVEYCNSRALSNQDLKALAEKAGSLCPVLVGR